VDGGIVGRAYTLRAAAGFGNANDYQVLMRMRIVMRMITIYE
jgi:hypothetical protein